MVERLTALLDTATVVPAVNHIEIHPYFQQREVQKLGVEHGIFAQAWAPIGGITFYRDSGHRSTPPCRPGQLTCFHGPFVAPGAWLRV